MRVALSATIFVLLGLFLIKSDVSMATPLPTTQEILSKPYKYLGETLKEGITPYDFYKAASKINTFFGFESLFKKQAIHNPFVWRQGGSQIPTPVPRGRPIAGPPFDIYTPTGVIPGCLNLLCPPPQGALWVDGVCWCTP